MRRRSSVPQLFFGNLPETVSRRARASWRETRLSVSAITAPGIARNFL